MVYLIRLIVFSYHYGFADMCRRQRTLTHRYW